MSGEKKVRLYVNAKRQPFCREKQMETKPDAHMSSSRDLHSTGSRGMKVMVALLFLVGTGAWGQTPQQHSEIKRLEDSLLAPCCYSQAVGQHMSDVAVQMRREITAMVLAGKNESEVIAHYKAVYGERILIVPDGKTGVLLFILPLCLALLALWILVMVLRKMLDVSRSGTLPNGSPVRQRIPQAIREEIERRTEHWA